MFRNVCSSKRGIPLRQVGGLFALALSLVTAPSFAQTRSGTITVAPIPSLGIPAITLPTTLPTVQGISLSGIALPTLDPKLFPGAPSPQLVNRWIDDVAHGRCPRIEIAPGRFFSVCVPVQQGTNPARRWLPTNLQSMDLRAEGLDSPVKDQGQVGSCWAFATTSLAENSLRRQNVTTPVSTMHILAVSSAKLDSKGLAGPAIAADFMLPYDERSACKLNTSTSDDCGDTFHVVKGSWRSDPELSARVARADAAGAFRIHETEVSTDPDELAAILSSRREVYASMYVDDVAWGHKHASSGVIQDYVCRNDCAGHAVTLVAFTSTPVGRSFLIKNSWGTDWGHGGYAWISEANLRAHLKYASTYEVYPRGINIPR